MAYDRNGNDGRRLDPGHDGMRSALRVIGPMMMAVGGILLAVGLIDFFSSFGSLEPPKLFWCAFIGMPIMAMGMGITKFAYMGKIARYVAGEAAPVARDTFNYMAVGTAEGVKNVASAIGQGISEGMRGKSGVDSALLACASCGAGNETDAKFCNECGSPILKAKVCASCGNENDRDSKFCDNCGNRF
ncbi:MAG: zinc ribbon domain-containing protein [Planctomycetes bacterium]|nr:zinc ribbon domain-containing protein [Planctomycetota bacterium]